ncbi:MAG TPA: hypothetical protein VGM58_04370 [Verrucomicrobiae bacterium]
MNFGERNRPGCSLTRLAANTTAVARVKMFGAGRTERQAGRLRSLFSDLDLVWVWFYKDVAPTALEIFETYELGKNNCSSLCYSNCYQCKDFGANVIGYTANCYDHTKYKRYFLG